MRVLKIKVTGKKKGLIKDVEFVHDYLQASFPGADLPLISNLIKDIYEKTDHKDVNVIVEEKG